MPPQLATLVYLSVVVWLFRRELRQKPNVTSALWIPLIWFFIIVTRTVSEWLAIFGLHVGGVSIEEGSPVDACISLALIVAGLRVLAQRRVTLAEVVRHNRWLAIFFLYCFLAVFWSDFPFVAFKRWFKILGQPVMVLVLMTEPDFELALTVMMKRCAIVIVPVSILFIKYFADLGRSFSAWTGQPTNTGVTMGKNALGVDCLIFGFFFVWHTLRVWKWEKGKPRRNELIFCAGFLCAIGWLLHMASSSTALVSLLVGILMVLLLGLPAIKKEFIGSYILFFGVICGLAQYVFSISDVLFKMLGKDPTLTDRVYVWRDCLSIPINPVIGVGFESFWLGERQQMMDAKWSWSPNEAHNGYLETYLNLGLLGLFIMLAVLLSAFWKSRRELLANFHFGRFRMGFLCATLIYNWTEAGFKALHPMWFMFYIIALDFPRPEPQPAPAEVVSESPPLEDAGQPAPQLGYVAKR